MFKKKLLTVAAIAFCAAIVTAATPKSQVNKATAGLIGDGAIDDLAFGNEEGKGIVFGQVGTYDTTTQTGYVELGWGKAFSDTLWISLYDGLYISGKEEMTESVQKKYGFDSAANDSVNVTYADATTKTESKTGDEGNKFIFGNDFAVSVAINNTFGVQANWIANWTEKKNVAKTITPGQALGNDVALIKSDVPTSNDGKDVASEYSKIKNFTRNNDIIFNFKGAGIENDGEVAFYAKLNKIYSKLNFDTKSNNYTSSTTYLGATKESVTADGINQTVTIRPGLEAEVGFNLANWGVAKPTVSLTEDFNIGFDIVKNKTNHNKVTEAVATRETVDTTYEYTPGKKLDWKNTLTPALTLDFDLLDNLTLKTKVGAAVAVSQQNTKAGKSKAVATTTTYTKASGLSSSTTVTTETGDLTDSKIFQTEVTPNIGFGVVYGIIPEKTNINFGVEVKPGVYSWKTTETTNSNINKVVTTENKDAQGETRTSVAVTLPENNANPANTETRKKEFSAGDTTATFNIGATWFFTENAKLDVYYGTNFNALFANTNKFGIDFTVLF